MHNAVVYCSHPLSISGPCLVILRAFSLKYPPWMFCLGAMWLSAPFSKIYYTCQILSIINCGGVQRVARRLRRQDGVKWPSVGEQGIPNIHAGSWSHWRLWAQSHRSPILQWEIGVNSKRLHRKHMTTHDSKRLDNFTSNFICATSNFSCNSLQSQSFFWWFPLRQLANFF